jgi:hypothetical protein
VILYNKEVQTAAIETETDLQNIEEEIRQRILREKEVEAERIARDKELEEESVKLDQEIEQEIRGMIITSFLGIPPDLHFTRVVRGGTCQYLHSTRIPGICRAVFKDSPAGAERQL